MTCELCKLAQGNDGFIITICKTCGIPLIVSRYHRKEFTGAEKNIIKQIFSAPNIRWTKANIELHAHCHITK